MRNKKSKHFHYILLSFIVWNEYFSINLQISHLMCAYANAHFYINKGSSYVNLFFRPSVSSLSPFLVQTQTQQIELCYLYIIELLSSLDLQSPHHVICIEINETYVASLSPWQRLFSIHGTVWAHLSFPFSMRNHAVAIYNHGNSRTNDSGFKELEALPTLWSCRSDCRFKDKPKSAFVFLHKSIVCAVTMSLYFKVILVISHQIQEAHFYYDLVFSLWSTHNGKMRR